MNTPAAATHRRRRDWENARKAPTANVAIVGGVIVAALLIFFVLRK
jgi:hypothetical protein